MLHLSYLLTKKNIKRLLVISYSISTIAAILILSTDFIYDISPIKFDNFFIKAPKIPYFIWFFIWFATVIYAHFLLFQYLNKQNSKYKELKIFTFATAIAFAMGGVNFLSVFRFPIFEYGNFGLAVYCILATYIIFRHQFLGINVVIQKGLFYSILIAALTSLYLILILIIELLFRGLIGYKSLVLSLSSAFIIALLFNPIRNRIQILIDRIFLGKTSEEFAHENELLKQELERSDRLKTASTLALGLAHEIKNPLTTIKTFAEFLPEKFKDEDFVNKFSKLVPSEVERINNIIHQLLDFSKPTPPSFKNTNIHHLINDILVFFNNEFLKKRIRISEAYSDSTLIIRVDPSQIKQALLNIILNGIDAMPTGGNIVFRTLIDNKYFKIYISDSGRGIAKEDLKHVFDPFFTTKDEGTGLGLSVTHQIIKNHKGTIEVQSEIGKGTTFVISLPLLGV